MLDQLKGKKTYIVVGSLIALQVAHAMGLITDEVYKSSLELMGTLGLGTLAAKINRIEKSEDTVKISDLNK